ncbi:unnamed protein product [Pylaiella littoralis]
MPSPAFGAFFEIFSEGVVLTVGTITTICFAERCWKRSAPLNVTGLLAGIVAVFYSVYALTYWFNGISGYDCTTLAAVNGTSMSASNALTFLHLFVKADASNRSNPKWRNFYRWVGIAATVFNWATLGVVHAMLTGTEVDGLDGPRCAMTFNLPSFRLKWIAQFVNQTFQAWMSGGTFVYPLILHLKIMEAGPAKTSQVDSVFATLVFGLAVLDNAVSLGAIIFAVHLPSFTGELPTRREGAPNTIANSNLSR